MSEDKSDTLAGFLRIASKADIAAGADRGADRRRRDGGNGFAAGVYVVGGALAIFLVAGQRPYSASDIDTSSGAYHLGYGNTYRQKGAPHARALYHDPQVNPYLTMPRREWNAHLLSVAGEGDDGECDPFKMGTGDWHDYGAGGQPALQDMAAGLEPRIPLTRGDPDCD